MLHHPPPNIQMKATFESLFPFQLLSEFLQGIILAALSKIPRPVKTVSIAQDGQAKMCKKHIVWDTCFLSDKNCPLIHFSLIGTNTPLKDFNIETR